MNTLSPPLSRALLGLALLAALGIGSAQAQMPVLPTPQVQLEESRTGEDADPFEGLDEARIPAGRLLGRAPAFVDVAGFDGSPATPAADLATWREVYLVRVEAGPHTAVRRLTVVR